MSELKICVRCKYCFAVFGDILCVSPNNELGVNLITGNMIYRHNSCRDHREKFIGKSDNICGKEGNWYEPKE